MAEFPATLVPTSLNGTNGFRIDGEFQADFSGSGVASAGDINGDGLDDVVIGAVFADPNGDASGASYVVFGRASSFDPVLSLADLDGHNGFKLAGQAAGDLFGISVSSAGDVNGDGIDDLIIGARDAGEDSANGGSPGASYVVFGQRGGFDPSLALSGLNGANGFKIIGENANDGSGRSVSSAGDVNGDGIDDLIVGAPYADASGNTNDGASYVVFGTREGFDATLTLSSLNGGNGFRIIGEDEGDLFGISVSSAGDVNGDGLDDLIIGANQGASNGDSAGATYVVFGSETGFESTLALSSLNGTNGFKVPGENAGDQSGGAVSSAGDINGDGFADIIIGVASAKADGRSAGTSYVVFGTDQGFDATLSLSGLNGSNGFELVGADLYDFSGEAVSTAGDVNGDGFDDIIVGATGADPNGTSNAGASYVVFGKASGFDPTLNLGNLDGTNGFRIVGVAGDDRSGDSVSSAGDVNGDGFADLIVASPSADPNGDFSGSSYVVFGRAPDAAVTRTGTDIANTIRGGAFNDRLIGLGGNDTLIGGAGNDALIGGAGADRLDGDDGIDTAIYTGSSEGVDVDLSGSRVGQFGGDAAGDVLSGIENVQGSAFADVITGDDGANALFGFAGNDTLNSGAGADRLDGGLGADLMTGGDGNDIFFVDDAGDTVFEAAGSTGGSDTVFVTAASWTLGAGQSVEYLRVNVGTGVSLTGNNLDQFIYGAAGADTLADGGGTDRLYGRLGDDTYLVDGVRSLVIENAGEGTDTVQASVNYTLRANVENLILTGSDALRGTGNAEANTITGNAGANVLSGGAGNDTLVGGLGKDQLTGGTGADTFVFRTIDDSTNANRDLIIGFTTSGVDADTIDLAAIDANTEAGGDQAFAFIGNQAFTGTAGELRAAKSGSYTLVEGDVDGNGTADFGILLQSAPVLNEGHFIL